VLEVIHVYLALVSRFKGVFEIGFKIGFEVVITNYFEFGSEAVQLV
jgi:hypothetical protein